MAAKHVPMDKRLANFNVHYQLDFRAASICSLVVKQNVSHEEWLLAKNFVLDLLSRKRFFNPGHPRPKFDIPVILKFMDGRCDPDRGNIIMYLVKAALDEDQRVSHYSRVYEIIEWSIEATK